VRKKEKTLSDELAKVSEESKHQHLADQRKIDDLHEELAHAAAEHEVLSPPHSFKHHHIVHIVLNYTGCCCVVATFWADRLLFFHPFRRKLVDCK
jgi:hypothetical protein